MNPTRKSLLTLFEYSPEEVTYLIALARDLKRARLHADPQVFAGRTGVLIFEKPSLRTRITFETAINELGGHALNLSAETVRMGIRESVADVARNLARWVHLIVARTFSQATVEQLAIHSQMPVINALTDKYHPCQALAFGMTLAERLPGARALRVVFVGDGNNVCNSIMVLCAQLGYQFTLVCPPGYEAPSDVVERCLELGRRTGGSIAVSHDAGSALATADAIYTDVWASMGQEDQAAQRAQDFRTLQVNDALLRHAPAGVLVSHCLPAHRGEEITSDVLDSPQCIAFDEAENRLHVQKAVISHMFT